MKNTLLSITIPTFNRAKDLEACLESIALQIREAPGLKYLVEVVISDNCSTDNTENVAMKYKNEFANFVYVKNETNVGFDRNTLNVVTHATSKYCWYLGDDDVVQNGGIELVVNQLKNGLYDVMTVEATPTKSDNVHTVKKSYPVSSLVEVSDGNEFYFKGYCQGGFSVLIFNREMWMSLVDAKDYLTHWLYYETVLKMLVATKKKILYVNEPVIVTGQDCRWSENGTELFTFINSNLLMEKMIGFGFDKERLVAELKKNSQKIPIMTLRAKGHGLRYTIKNLKYMYDNLPYARTHNLLAATLVYFVPNFVVRLVRDTKKKLS